MELGVEEKSSRNQRSLKNLIIYPRFQLTLVGVNLVIFIGALGLILYQVKRSYWMMDKLAHEMRIPPHSAYYKLVGFQQELITDYILTATVVGVVISFVFTVIFSHKSAGALYRLRRYFEEINESGHKYDLKFRDGDFYSELPPIINNAIKKIKGK
jgi:hypothetical protein